MTLNSCCKCDVTVKGRREGGDVVAIKDLLEYLVRYSDGESGWAFLTDKKAKLL